MSAAASKADTGDAIDAAAFLEAAAARGTSFYTGVPCSYLTPLINAVASSRSLDYVKAASEGEAVAIAAGAWLAGRGTAVMCQNSGLGNAVNPLTSLNHPFRIPTLLVVTWRGEPGHKDEPQHALMGRITENLLRTVEVPHGAFPRTPAAIAPALDAADAAMARGTPYAMVMHQDSVRPGALHETRPQPAPPGARRDWHGGERPTRAAVLERLLADIPPDAAVIATTGKCGRELFTLDDRPQHLYQVGSMGGASGMGLGVALNTARPVVVLDGDGAALMKLGTLATIGAHRPPGLVHVLLDNGVHDSTGGQMTVSDQVDFAAVALACSYRGAADCEDLAGFSAAFRWALARPGPTLLRVRITPGSMPTLGRPTIAPHEVAQRFRTFLAQPVA